MRSLSAGHGARVLIALSALMFLGSTPVQGGPNSSAVLALHATGVAMKNQCAVGRQPCTSLRTEWSTYNPVTGEGAGFTYVLVMEANATEGIAGVEFGIAYNDTSLEGVDFFDTGGSYPGWTSCADLTFAETGWPASGTGILLTWNPTTHCQQVEPGGTGTGVVAVAGYFYVAAYSADVLRITPRPSSGLASVSSCAGVEDIISTDRLGSAAYSEDGSLLGKLVCNYGLPPCMPSDSCMTFDCPDSLPEFARQTFQIGLSSTVASSWGSQGISDLGHLLHSAGADSAQDFMSSVWNYLTTFDIDPGEKIDMYVPGGHTRYLPMRIYVPGDTNVSHSSNVACGYYAIPPHFDSGLGGGTVFINLGDGANLPSPGEAYETTIPHELTHLIMRRTEQLTPLWANEMFATFGEFLAGARWQGLVSENAMPDYGMSFLPDPCYGITGTCPPPSGLDIREYCPPYNPPCPGTCGEYGASQACKYDLYRLFGAYVMSQYAGPTSGPEDDLLYQWIRTPHTSSVHTGTFQGLRDCLDNLPAALKPWYADKLGLDPDSAGFGTRAVARVLNRFGIAKFVDNSSSSFGGNFGFPMVPAPSGAMVQVSPTETFGLFHLGGTDSTRLSIVYPPERVLGAEFLASPVDSIQDTWFYPGTSSNGEAVEVLDWSTEYVILRADLAEFADNTSELFVTVSAPSQVDPGHEILVSYVTYSVSDSALWLEGLHATQVVEECAKLDSANASASFTLGALGRDLVNAVVITLTMVENPISEMVSENWSAPLRVPFKVRYELRTATGVPSDAKPVQERHAFRVLARQVRAPRVDFALKIADTGGDGSFDVRVDAFDVSGRRVGVILSERMVPGSYERHWDVGRGRGSFANGIYILRMTVDGKIAGNERVALIR